MENKEIDLCCGRRGCLKIMKKEKRIIISHDNNHAIYLTLEEFEELKRFIKENKI